jgi:hypothetical protein
MHGLVNMPWPEETSREQKGKRGKEHAENKIPYCNFLEIPLIHLKTRS